MKHFHLGESRRHFLQNISILFAGAQFLTTKSWAKAIVNEEPLLAHNVPKVILNNKRVQLKFDPEVLIMDDGLQPTMLCTKKGTLIVQSWLSVKPYPQERIFYPYAVRTVVSRDGGKKWDEFKLKAGDNGVDMEGGILQLKDGSILVLETYVTPGAKPETGEGLLFISNDEYRTLQGPINITFNLPEADFYGSADDTGRPQPAMRLHRRIIELPNGDLLTTLYGWMKGDRTPSGYVPKMMKTRVMLLKSTNKGRHWDYVSTIAADSMVGTEGFGEPVLLRVSKGPKAGRLICQMRTGRELYQSISDDGGKTWSKAKPHVFAGLDVYKTELWADMFKDVRLNGQLVTENPNEFIAAVVDPDLIELRSGVLVAAFGVRIPARAHKINPTHPWNGNYLAFSLDHGDTWSQVTQLTSGVATTHYMSIEEMPKSNELFVAYDFGFRGNKTGRYTYGRKMYLSITK